MNFKEILDRYREKMILITGGVGCIGSNLVRILLHADPEKIIVLDDLSASYEWNLPIDSKVLFVNGSILDEEKMKRAFYYKPQYVFHLAAHFANQNSIDHPETDLMVNGLGTLRILEHANLVDVEICICFFWLFCLREQSAFAVQRGFRFSSFGYSISDK